LKENDRFLAIIRSIFMPIELVYPNIERRVKEWLEKKELVDALKLSDRELQQGIETHCNIVASILKEPIDERNLQPILKLLPKKIK
jgi:hypothetical protein